MTVLTIYELEDLDMVFAADFRRRAHSMLEKAADELDEGE